MQNVNRSLAVSFALAFLVVMMPAVSGQAPSGRQCASENEQCSFNGTAEVHYGAADRWVKGTFTNGVACNNATFGDPIPGVVKTCVVVNAPPAPPPSPSGPGRKCADEDQFCFFAGAGQVSYGANGRWAARSSLNGVACNNATFGDPIPGVVKACFVTVVPQAPVLQPLSPPATATPPVQVTFERWIGTAPFCGASPNDCRREGLTYIRSDDSSCTTGTKVLCRGTRAQPGAGAREVWIGTAPFCGASQTDCQRLGMNYIRSDDVGGGNRCTTGTKVLCASPASAVVREWVGTAPFCNASANDCTRRGLKYVRSDPRGDGDLCSVGTKVFCEGTAGDYTPQSTGVTDSLNQAVSNVEVMVIKNDLKRKSEALMPYLEGRLQLASTYLQQIANANPQVLAEAAAAYRRRDLGRVNELLRLQDFASQLNRPSGLAQGPNGETGLRHASATRGGFMRTAWHPVAAPPRLRALVADVNDRTTAGPPAEARLAQTNVAFKTFLFSPITAVAAGAGVGAFTEDGSAMTYPVNFISGRSTYTCRQGYSVPALTFHVNALTIGEWTDDVENMTGNYHGFAPSLYGILGFGVGFWWDYDGNFKGWTLTFGVGLGTDGVYTRKRIDADCNKVQ